MVHFAVNLTWRVFQEIPLTFLQFEILEYFFHLCIIMKNTCFVCFKGFSWKIILAMVYGADFLDL